MKCSPALAHLVLACAVTVGAVAAGSCSPLGLAGASCSTGPCAAGLTCVQGICTQVEPTPPPPPPCAVDEDCVLDGSADGRACSEGVCGYAECTFDLQCGTRICENGVCADRELCLNDESCGEGRVCVGNACREACVADEECPSIGGTQLSSCIEGECVQRCLGDFMCLQGICDNNLCVAPQCEQDDDCEGPGWYFCDASRCVQFSPCESEEDCFDPNFLCNELGRCEERAACTIDAECGTELCLDRHCRDALSCNVAEGCGSALECIAGRCVEASTCRSDVDCSPTQVCDAARCVAAPAAVEPAMLVVRTPHGPCIDGIGGACDVVCLAGSEVALRTQGYDTAGIPVAASITVTGADGVVLDRGRVSLPCPAAALSVLAVHAGLLTVDVRLRSVAHTGELTVIVTDARGAPVSGAAVLVGASEDALAGVTQADGSLAIASFTGGVVGAHADGRGVVVLDAAAGVIFLALPGVDVPTAAAGFRARVNGTGDELGDVGVGLALPSTRSALSATPAALFGEPFAAEVELPVLGAVPIALPAAVTLDATLLLVGAQEVKALAFATAVFGPGALLALEGRFDRDLLFNLALGADPLEAALDLAALAEGMDSRVAGAGSLTASALVVDGDLADDIEDIDGDGDVLELVPDYASFLEIEVQPDSSPLERVGMVVSPPPDGANARMLAVCGVELAHGFLPLGVGVLFGTSDGEQLKLKSASAAMSSAPRVCVAQAIFGDGSTSAAQFVGDAFAPLLDVGSLLAPPVGSFLLEGVPTADRTSVVVPEAPGADALAVTVLDGDIVWLVVGAARGSLPLPGYIAPIALGTANAYVLGVDVAVALSAPLGSLDDVARAVATAP